MKHFANRDTTVNFGNSAKITLANVNGLVEHAKDHAKIKRHCMIVNIIRVKTCVMYIS